MEEYEDSGTTQKEDVEKTPAKMLPSMASIPSHIDTKYLMVKTLAGTPTLSTCSLQIAEVIL